MAQNIPDDLPQIGPGTLALLRAKGIHTNIDILYYRFPDRGRSTGKKGDDALCNIPGVGLGREAILREWARKIPLTESELQLQEEHRKKERERAEKRRRTSAIEAERSNAGCQLQMLFFAVVIGGLILLFLIGNEMI